MQKKEISLFFLFELVILPTNSGFAMLSLKVVVGEGFEPSKSVTADLQSAPFGRSGTPPDGADYRNRTGDLLITSQLLYLLS